MIIDKPKPSNTESGKAQKLVINYIASYVQPITYKDRMYQIIPNSIKEDPEYIKLANRVIFAKPWYEYANIKNVNLIFEDEFNKIKQQDKEREERKKRIQQEEAQEIERLTKLANPKDQDWVLKYIGWVSDQTKFLTLAALFNQINSTDWCIYDDEIYIKETCIDRIKDKTLLKPLRWNIYRKKKPHNIIVVKTLPNDSNRHRGVYGVWVNDELFYIGSTNRSFEERFAEHQINLQTKSNKLSWYSKIKPTDKIEYIPIIDITEVNCDRALDATDIQSMELALILAYRPEGNIAGIKTEFKYN